MKKRIFLSSVIALLSVLCCISPAFAAQQTVSGHNWMSTLADDIPFTQINLPGTHDSCACYVGLDIIAQNQDKDIPQQLNMGIRFFDIRLKNDDGDLICSHSAFSCKTGYGLSKKLTAQQVTQEMTAFLQNNPQETIFFFLREEYTDTRYELYDIFYETCIEPNRDFWYLHDRITTLENVRGKIVLINNYRLVSSKYGSNETGIVSYFTYVENNEVGDFYRYECCRGDIWQYSYVYYQDSVGLAPDEKWETVQRFWEEPLDTRDLNINFSSCSGTRISYYTSRYINAKLRSYPFETDRYYGILAMDFAQEETVRAYYMTNAGIMTKPVCPGEPLTVTVRKAPLQTLDKWFLNLLHRLLDILSGAVYTVDHD